MVFNEKQEQFLYKFGQELFKQGYPLGFLNSDGFNPHFQLEGRFKGFVEKLRIQAESELDFEVGSTGVYKDLKFALWMLTQTYNFVFTSPKAHLEAERKFSLGKRDVRFGSLDLELIEQVTGLTTRQKTALKKIFDGLCDYLQGGVLPFPNLVYSTRKATVPESFMNFVEGEYMVVPYSVVMGYQNALRKEAQRGIVEVVAHRSGGMLRDFNVTTDQAIISKVYHTPELLEEIYTSKVDPATLYTVPVNGVSFLSGFTRAQYTFYDLGISEASDYPQRRLDLSRIKSVRHVTSEEEVAKKLREARRYASMDEGLVVNQVRRSISKLGVEEQQRFLNETLNKMKDQSGSKDRSDVKLGSSFDFQLQFNQAVEFYSTAYLRVLYDYMQENPALFGNLQGNRVSASVVTGSTTGNQVNVATDDVDDELEF